MIESALQIPQVVPQTAPQPFHFMKLNATLFEFKALLDSVDISVQTDFSSAARAAFESLDGEKQQMLVQQFGGYVSLLRGIANSSGLKSNRQLSWQAIGLLGLRPPHDLLELIEEDDLVEIYSRDQIQIFRNLKFFQLCSYSVPDILLNEWPVLYQREPDLTPALLQLAEESMKRGGKAIRIPSEPHILSEKFSTERRRFKIFDGYGAPLWSRADKSPIPVAFLVTKKAVQIT